MYDETKRASLKATANEIRKWTLEMLCNLGVGHVGGSLSIIDMLTVLYFDKMNIDPANPKWEERDRFILSKGHAGPGLYATLARRGFMPKEMLDTLNRPYTNLPSHCDMIRTPGIDQTTGSLGQGISCAVGHAIAQKMRGRNNYVYAMVGDGEIQEGQAWEAFMLAGARKLDNFIVFVDNNGLQVDGKIEEVVDIQPLADKMRAFNFKVLEIDGHDLDQISDAIEMAKDFKAPTCIIAKTVKGRGFKPLEGTRPVHNTQVTPEILKACCDYIDATY
nr:transketolase [Maliibacterium massiliense]